MNLRIEPRSILLLVAALLSGVLLLLLVYWTLRAILLFYLAIIIAESLRPLVSRIATLRIPRPAAIGLVYLALAVSVAILVALVAVPLVRQSTELARQAPDYASSSVQQFLEATGLSQNQDILQQIESSISQMGGQLLGLSTFLIRVPLAIFSTVVELVLVIVISVYWLLASQALGELVISVVPGAHHQKVIEVARAMSYRVGSYVRGVAILALSVGIMTYIGLLLLGMPYAVALAVFAGITEVIPTVGPVIGAIPAIVIALFVSPVKAVTVAGLY